MSKTTLQIPLDTVLRRDAEEAAKEQGFSSLQELVRVILKKVAGGKIEFRIEEGVRLSNKAVKRYDEMTEDVAAGKVETKVFNNTDDVMDYLNS